MIAPIPSQSGLENMSGFLLELELFGIDDCEGIVDEIGEAEEIEKGEGEEIE